MFRPYVTLALSIVAGFALAETPHSGPPAPIHVQVTTWSRSARPLPYSVNPDPALRNERVLSPNGKYAIACSSVPHEEMVSASVSEKVDVAQCEFEGRGQAVPIDLKVGPEALWAPDSEAMALTQSRGGAIGPYQVLIYRPQEARANDIANEVRRDLARRFPACVGEGAGCSAAQRKRMKRNTSWVNVAAIRWMEKSDRLLLMAWVPDSSEFGANLGHHMGYVVNAHTGRIVNRYSEAEFTKRFKKYCGDWGL